MAGLKWTPELSVGIVSIDNQHKYLIVILNQLTEAMLKGTAQSKMTEVFEQLIQYTADHFTFEEKMLEEFDYDGLKAHKDEHASLIRQLQELKNKHESGKVAVTGATHKFLQTWLKAHILGTDHKYSKLLIRKGAK